MKRIAIILLTLLSLLTGCSGHNEELEQVMGIRAKLLAGVGCSFETVITADYQDAVYTFRLKCRADEYGAMSFAVMEPDTIAGITGRMDAKSGEIIFDDRALAFDRLADGQLTPVSAPWLFVKILRSGYVTACTKEDGLLRATINDSYEEDTLKGDIWFADGEVPQNVELCWKNRKILSMEIKNFEIL